jgi:hypothetical protein
MDLKILKDLPPWEWPEGTAEVFLRTLRDGGASGSERMLAAELAGDITVINDEIADALLCIARSSEELEVLRREAVLSLGPVLDYVDMEGFEDPYEATISEKTFHTIRESLHELYMGAGIPEDVRRKALEASVQSPQDWQPDAVRKAYNGRDNSWKLSAVSCMRFIPGFKDQILEALESKNEDIHYEAVCAAGSWGLDSAWSHVAGLVTSKGTDKPLLLAAIDAAACIRPEEAAEILIALTASEDEEIAEAAQEALAMAEGYLGGEDEEDEDELFY